ncbi:MAG: RecX family transcriptional regulator, partial [Alphaproteobacteria bacterium]|nr:RecX family transcriptional regulator [Alphaproteobacteria bacterium]
MGQDSLPSGNSKPSSRSRPQKKQRGPKKPKKITPEYLHNSGLYYLERFSSSSANFRAVMLRKAQKSCYAWPEQDFDACTRMVDELVQKFIRLELLNDALYTRSKIYSLRRAGKSRRFIFSSLGVKGLEKNMIEKALAAYDAEHGLESSEKDAALTFAR